jgi:DNA primase
MSFPPAFLDELRFRVRLTDVVGRKTRLVRAGREWKACCPFHNEKTPSFYINEDKGFYHCFGCGVHGDVIRFVVEQEGLSFPEAVRQLAGEAGLEVPQERPEDKEKAAKVATLHEVMAAAQQYFAEKLGGISGTEARGYFARRALSAETIRRFGLGWAPDSRTGLKDALRAKGVDEALMVEAGLLINIEGKAPYDRFRGRVMFPIRDPKGRVIAFGGRILDQGEPKYLNSPDTPLFDKGRSLYNFDQAGPTARKSNELFVAEGYMDVIALAQAGIPNAVAPLGTALTEDQMKLMWRVVPEPTLCLDGDAAGQRAAVRAAQRALPGLAPGRSLRFLTLPQGEDPDSLVRKSGAAAFLALKEQAQPLIETLWQFERAAGDLSTPERRADFKSRLRQLSQQITDPSVRGFYETEFNARMEAMFGRRAGPSRMAGPRAGAPFGVVPPSPALKRMADKLRADSGRGAMARCLLLAAIRHPDALLDDLDLLADLPCESAEDQALRDQIVTTATRDPHGLDSTRLKHTLAQLGYSGQIDRLEAQDRLRLPFASLAAESAQVRRGFAHAAMWLRRMAAVETELASVTAQLAEEMTESAYARQQQLAMERRRLIDEQRSLLGGQS